MQAVMRAGLRYLPLVLLALAWEAVTRLNLVDTSALPPLSKVATAWIDLVRGGELIDNGKTSLYRGSVGLVLAVFGGGADVSTRLSRVTASQASAKSNSGR